MKNTLKSFLLKKGYTPIKLYQLKSGHFSLKGEINYVKARFILDTGASSTVVDSSRADKFSITMERSDEDAAGLGTATMKRFEADGVRVEIKGFLMESRTTNLVDLSHVNQALKMQKISQIDCIIGADILNEYLAVIDYETRYLFLKEIEEMEEGLEEDQ